MKEHIVTKKKIVVLLLMLLSLTFLLLVAGRANPIIEIEDEGLEKVVREKLDRPNGLIYETDLLTITELDASDQQIVSLNGIERFSRLVNLNLDNNTINDLTPLENLSMLRNLSLQNNNISSLEDINFHNISHLHIRELYIGDNVKDDNQLSDISLLDNLYSLEILDLKNNDIENLSPLVNLTSLESLNLSNNQIYNLEAINFDEIIHLPIRELDLSNNVNDGNYLSDLKLLQGLRTLEVLNLRGNKIEDLSPLAFLNNLEDLNIRDNSITDLERVNFNEITHLPLRRLSLRHNVNDGIRISDIRLLERMTLLEELELRDNHIEDLSSLSRLTNLEILDLQENRISNIEPLSELANLQELDLRLNNIEDLGQLSNLSMLEVLDLRENNFKDIEALTELSELKSLNLRDNDIDSIDPLKNLVNLEYLNIHSNSQIQSIKPIENLVKLETLIMRKVPINDKFHIFRQLTNLQNLNALETGINKFETDDIISELRAQGGLQGEVLPIPLLHTLAPPSLSEIGGFYENELSIEINTEVEDGEIYYTTDGSTPTNESHTYLSGDRIDLKIQNEDDPIVVRAKVISNDNNISKTITQTYFLSESVYERYTFPVISIATDRENFFDEEMGIYTNENATNTGRDWERPIHIELYEPDGTQGFSQNAGVRIHGGATREYRQKTLRLYADYEYDVEDTFNYEIFEGLTSISSNEPINNFKRLLLRNSGNDWNSTMFRDAMMQSLVEPLGTMDTQAYRPSIVYFNGEYWGIHNIRERYDEYYLENVYNVPREDVVILQSNGMVDKGDAEGEEHYNAMIDYIQDNGVTDEGDFQYVESMMDVENFRDYIIVQTFFGNTDWPHNNTRFWRLNSADYEDDVPLGHDGRWRWMLFDTDFGFGRYSGGTDRQGRMQDYSHDTIQWVMNEFSGRLEGRTWPNFLIRSMLENEAYRTEFLLRYADLLNSYFDPEVVRATINSMQNEIEPEIEKHINRWNAIRLRSMDTWYNNVEYLHTFALNRPYYIRQHLMNEFNLNGTVKLRVNISDSLNKGIVKINTLDINESLPGMDDLNIWEGEYFQGLPIQLSADAYPGYEFSHWEGVEENYYTNNIEISPAEDKIIRPIFIKK